MYIGVPTTEMEALSKTYRVLGSLVRAVVGNWSDIMRQELETLIDEARSTTMSCDESEAQRRSFAYGNTNIENDKVTKESINTAATRIDSGHGSDH